MCLSVHYRCSGVGGRFQELFSATVDITVENTEDAELAIWSAGGLMWRRGDVAEKRGTGKGLSVLTQAFAP